MIIRYDELRMINVSPAATETAAPPPPPSPEEAEECRISITMSFALSFEPTWIADPSLIPPLLHRQRTAVVPCGQFFAEPQSSSSRGVIRRIASGMHVALTAEAVDDIALQTRTMSRAAIAENPSARVVPFQVSVEAVRHLDSPAHLEELTAELVAEQSAREAIRTVPATKASVESLEYATVEEARDQGRCTICLEEIDNHDDHDDDDDQDCDQRAVRMPCWHVYHKDCIVQWLEKNHKCPLCRHAMPTN